MLAFFGVALLDCNLPKLTRTGSPQPPKPKSCNFALVTTMPKGDFAEIGVVDLVNHYLPTADIETFKDKITPKVCEAGGDVAIAYANGQGAWVKATVLKKLTRVSKRESDAAPRRAKRDGDGCKYDTQCKGDRICVDGACVAPAAAAPSGSAPPDAPEAPQ